MRGALFAVIAGLAGTGGCAQGTDAATGKPPSTSAGASAPITASEPAAESRDRTAELVRHVLGDLEDVWSALFTTMGREPYPKPWLVLYTGTLQSACGMQTGGAHPGYCPHDGKVYLDATVLDELARSGPTGDLAQALLIAHEVGHHVQHVLGTSRPTLAPPAGSSEPTRREWTIRLELQADCYAGVWAHFVRKRNLLEPGDIESSVPSAVPKGGSVARGSPEQRLRWFRHGLASGDPRQCDTFGIAKP